MCRASPYLHRHGFRNERSCCFCHSAEDSCVILLVGIYEEEKAGCEAKRAAIGLHSGDKNEDETDFARQYFASRTHGEPWIAVDPKNRQLDYIDLPGGTDSYEWPANFVA